MIHQPRSISVCWKITWNLSRCWMIQGTTASDWRWNGTVPAVNNSITLVLSSYNTVNDLRVKVTIFWVYSHHHAESRLRMQWYDLEVLYMMILSYYLCTYNCPTTCTELQLVWYNQWHSQDEQVTLALHGHIQCMHSFPHHFYPGTSEFSVGTGLHGYARV